MFKSKVFQRNQKTGKDEGMFDYNYTYDQE